MAGGGTGGHVIPLIAVARELQRAGHEPLFVGTDRGVEARLVPAAGFRLEKIRVGGLKNLGILTKLMSLWRLAAETFGQWRMFSVWKPAAVFSMGGYVAGPPVLAALARGVPVILMEPNAVPGVTNRWIAGRVKRALLNFEETRRFFPAARTEMTGVPVREEFFNVPAKQDSAEFTLLITGGSLGSRTLNEAARASWPLFREAGLNIRFRLQTGAAMEKDLTLEFAESGLSGEVTAFITDMPAAFSEADLVISRSGAGTVSELAAAGRPAVLVPFPFSADDHQTSNARERERAGAAIVFVDREWTGEKLFATVRTLMDDRAKLHSMAEAARKFTRPGAARRAAEIVIEEATKSIDSTRGNRNNK